MGQSLFCVPYIIYIYIYIYPRTCQASIVRRVKKKKIHMHTKSMKA